MTDEHLCVTCSVLHLSGQPRHYERAQVCEPCRLQIGGALERLPEATTALPAALPRTQAPQTSGSRIRSTPQSSEPLNWTPFDLLLPADIRKRELLARAALGLDPDQIGDLSVATILDTWARDWASYRDEYLPDPTVPALCRWLADRLGWACDEHPAIDEFAAEVVALARTVSVVARTDRSQGEKIGRCPQKLRDDSRCNTVLRVDPYADQIQCNRCGTRWNRRKGEWMQLRAAQLDAMKESAA